MIQDALVSRRRLLDLLQSPSSSAQKRDYAYDPQLLFGSDEESFRVLWRDDDDKSGLPAVILVDKSKQRDFFAWVTSFAPWMQPFSAFCRVVDPDFVEFRRSRPSSVSLSKLMGGWLGAVLAETFVLRVFARASDRLTLRQSMGTFSFCASRLQSLGLDYAIEDLLEDWVSAKDLIENRRAPHAKDLREFWRIVGALSARRAPSSFNPDEESIFQCCADILEYGEEPGRLEGWHRVTRQMKGLDNVPELMTGTREDRVIIVERVIRELIQADDKSKQVKAFACGYIVSLLAPGTLDHLSMLEAVTPVFPTAALWYGLCAGFRNSDSVQAYSAGMGRRIARELLRKAELTDPPTCDISLSELRVVGTPSRSAQDFMRYSGSAIEVEVAPCISCWFRHGNSQDFSAHAPKPELQALLDQIEDLTSRFDNLQRSASKLASSVGLTSKETRRKGRK